MQGSSSEIQESPCWINKNLLKYFFLKCNKYIEIYLANDIIDQTSRLPVDRAATIRRSRDHLIDKKSFFICGWLLTSLFGRLYLQLDSNLIVITLHFL